MLRSFTLLSALLLSFFVSFTAAAQKTGGFDTSINFMSQPRQLSVYVPTNYTPSQPQGLMICLHGLGDNCTAYRNALVNGLAFPTYVPNTIFVCPEASATTSDFFSPAGAEAIIQKSIDYARSIYNIDTTNIVLQGFSLGGRAALRYGLDHYATFRGLLLNTPAIQGMKEALNRSKFAYTFNYNNAPRIPIYITHGATDILYTGPIDSVYRQLIRHDGPVRYYDFPNMGHSIPNMQKIKNYQAFFSAPFNGPYDADVVSVNSTDRSCSASVPVYVLVRNTGQNTIFSIQLQYSLNGTPQNYTWNGSLPSSQHAAIALPVLTATAGTNILNVKILSLNGSIQDTITANNSNADTFTMVNKGQTLPLSEGFEGSMPGWLIHGSGDVYPTWAQDNTVARTGQNSVSGFNTVLIFENSGMKEDLLSPVLDLTSVAKPELTFDVAFNDHLFTPPYALRDTLLADTLEVAISTDCGSSYVPLYKKGGKDLATFKKPILNPINLNAVYIAPADSNWRMERIDLSSYASNNKAVIRFRYISDMGGSINLDNVKVATLNNIHEIQTSGFSLYPNPANEQVTILTGAETIHKVEVLDVMGRCVLTAVNKSQGNVQINTSALTNGIYFFQVYTDAGKQTSRVLIQR